MSTKLPAVLIADYTSQLATAISVGGTTATVALNTDDDGVTIPDGLIYLSVDGGNASKEHISAVKTGANLASIQSVSRQGALTSGVARAHRIGATVALTDFATIKYMNDLLTGTTSLNASTPLGYDGTASVTTANQLATKAYVDGVAIAGAADSSTTVKGISKLSTAPVSGTNPIVVGDNDTRVPTQNENDALVGTSGTATSSSNKLVDAADVSNSGASGKIVRLNATAYPAGNGSLITGVSVFGGTGADGALSITSGTTNIDCGAKKIFIKNYSSVSITGTGALTFSNPNATGTIVILRCSGACTVTSSTVPAIGVSGMGAAASTNGIGLRQQNALTGSGATAGGATTPYYPLNGFGINFIDLIPGSGGVTGGLSGSGAGGKGGGALYIECAGALNITSTIWSKGLVGANAGNAAAFNGGPGGGGGGCGGYIGIVYGTLTANSGTYTVTGAAGGNGGNGGGGGGGGTSGGAGGAGGSFVLAGANGGASASASGNPGNAGSASTDGAGGSAGSANSLDSGGSGGGGGGRGTSAVVAVNTN